MPLAKKTKKAMQAAERRRNESPEAKRKRREANRLYMLNKRATESQRRRKAKNQLQQNVLTLHKHESSQSRVLRQRRKTVVYSDNLRTCENSQSREKTLSNGLEYSSEPRNAESPVKMGKPKQHKYLLKKPSHSSEMQRLRRQREELAKRKRRFANATILFPKEISSQCVEHTTTSLGSSDAVVTIEKDNLTSALELYMKSSCLPELNINDVLIVRSNESMLFEGENVESAVPQKSSHFPNLKIDDALIERSNYASECFKRIYGGGNIEPRIPQNSDDAPETNIEGRLIISSKESGIFKCKKEPSVENNLDEVSEINTEGRLIVFSKESEIFQCKEELPVEDELGTRSSAADESYRPFTAIKQETPDPEFVSVSEEISIAEFASVPEESPLTKFALVPDYCQCPNPKCLESISQLKKKVAGLEFQLRESLRMSGEMYLKVQSVVEEKGILESKLRISEMENSSFKQRYKGCFVPK